jgi:hypothetical protein
VLASILPGLRDIRTPLAAGYLWIVVVWLLFHDYIPKSVDEAQGAIGSLYQLGALLGGAAGLAAVSSAAYLVGSILVIRPERLGRLIQARGEREDKSLDGGRESPPPLPQRQQQLARFVDVGLMEFGNERTWFTVQDHVDVLGQMLTRTTYREEKSYDEVRQAYLQAVVDDYPAIAIRLQAKNRDLWETYDRHRAEAEFRLGIAPPLALASIILAVQASPWWLCLLLIPAALLMLARRESKEATLTLIQVITLKMVEPPAFERLREVAVMKERGPGKPRDNSRDAQGAPPVVGPNIG